MHLHLQLDRLLLVFAAFVLEPDPDDPGTEAGHLYELFFHKSVRPRVSCVACSINVLKENHRTWKFTYCYKKDYSRATLETPKHRKVLDDFLRHIIMNLTTISIASNLD